MLLVPIDGDHSHVVIATADPLNVEALEQIGMCYDRPIQIVVSSPEQITKAINSIRTSLMSDRSSSLSQSNKKGTPTTYHINLKST